MLCGRGGGTARAPPDQVDTALASMPAPLMRALLPFQREGVRFALERRGRVLLADEMGVGKTVQALAIASCYRVRAASQQVWIGLIYDSDAVLLALCSSLSLSPSLSLTLKRRSGRCLW